MIAPLYEETGGYTQNSGGQVDRSRTEIVDSVSRDDIVDIRHIECELTVKSCLLYIDAEGILDAPSGDDRR